MSLEMKYFVLKPRGDNHHAAASRRAMRAYADVIQHVDAGMADDLRAWADREHEQACIAWNREQILGAQETEQ